MESTSKLAQVSGIFSQLQRISRGDISLKALTRPPGFTLPEGLIILKGHRCPTVKITKSGNSLPQLLHSCPDLKGLRIKRHQNLQSSLLPCPTTTLRAGNSLKLSQLHGGIQGH